MTETNTKLTPIEAINEFYKLKSKYEAGYYEKYVNPIVKSNQSKREKRVAYSKLPKHECINCKRNVGTIWDIRSVYVDDIKYYKAKCGDLENPCPLDIQINYSFRDLMDKSISTGLSQIETIKMEFIKEKNNALFFNKNIVDTSSINWVTLLGFNALLGFTGYFARFYAIPKIPNQNHENHEN